MTSLFRIRICLLVVGLAALPVEAAKSYTGSAGELVDINRATLPELMHVPGMTTSWAGRIIRFRPYRTKLDLVEKGVVTREVYQRIRDGVVAHRMVEAGAKH
jgi:DNA uptake protein ComE-like DNA-binding protein